MPSIRTILAEAPNHRLYPIWLDPIFRHVTNATISVYYLVGFLNDWTVVIVALGFPYLPHKLYRHDEDDETEPTKEYSQMIKALDALWDHYSNFWLHIIPVLFQMVATSGVPLCSSASFAATITFAIGTASIATRMIFKVKAKTLQNEYAVNEWLRASQTSWHQIPNKSFWVLLSLPNLGFFLSVGLLIVAVILTIWKCSITGTTPSLEPQGCPVMKLGGHVAHPGLSKLRRTSEGILLMSSGCGGK